MNLLCVPFTWKLAEIKPTKREDDALDTSSPMVPRDTLLRSYIVWRRSAFLLVLPFLIMQLTIQAWSLKNEVDKLNEFYLKLTALGWFTRGELTAVTIQIFYSLIQITKQ